MSDRTVTGLEFLVCRIAEKFDVEFAHQGTIATDAKCASIARRWIKHAATLIEPKVMTAGGAQ